ncbi:dihydroorotate dehydrogenase [Halothermothrix orenii]|uniref:Dihydroorotate dehydrogenase n=1 Tax=Halothermothrix orenii (strain H 168 / OCM 544 / DSM 9562) TaxID=373903 RepID=B8CWM9_HALOH|nr:dihydroorotate dehydrogenase [Halothermothrix orenii]ACL69698.1 dihydroorotate oxidase B, catalytic subunit [Halothermothrix orenii H 168]
MDRIDLSVDLGPLSLKNPVMTASGTCGYGIEFKDYYDLNKLGAIVIKGLTLKPCSGNLNPRIAETTGGLLNSIGLENPGIESFIKNYIGVLRDFKIPVIVNISGHAVEDFARLADKLAPYSEISALEVNVSCPNLAGGGMAFGTDSELVYRVTKKVKENYPGSVIVKLSPNVTDIVEIARAAESAGADVLSLINTLLGMAIDVEKQKPVLGNIFGGLSGPAIKPVALRMVYQVAQQVEIPIIGMGGIMSGKDALEFILAGASAVAVGTANLVDPLAGQKVLREIHDYLIKHNIERIGELKGKAL